MDNLEDWINHRRPIRPSGDLIYDKLIANRKLMRISPKFYSVNLIYKARRQKTDQTNERLEHSEDFLIENKTHRSGVLCIFIAKNMLSL